MLQWADEEAESGRRAGDVFKAKDAPRDWLEPACVEVSPDEVPAEIGVATLAEVPTHSPSGRRLPLLRQDAVASACARASRAARRAWRSGSGVRTLRATAHHDVDGRPRRRCARPRARRSAARGLDAQPGADRLVAEPQRRCAPRTGSGHSPSASSVRWVTPIVGRSEHLPEVEGQAGAARMVAPGGVDDQDVRARRQLVAPPAPAPGRTAARAARDGRRRPSRPRSPPSPAGGPAPAPPRPPRPISPTQPRPGSSDGKQTKQPATTGGSVAGRQSSAPPRPGAAGARRAPRYRSATRPGQGSLSRAAAAQSGTSGRRRPSG